MSSLAERIYAASPVWLQNLALSLKGWQFRRERLSGRFAEYLANALERQWLSEEELQAFQLQVLKRLLQHAYDTVPYYRDTYGALGLNPADVESLSDLENFPYLEKDVFRENPQALVSSAVPPKKRRVIHTSGSTGTPLSVFYASDERQQSYALVFRQYEWGGYRLGMRRAKFGARPVVPSQQSRPPFWRYDRAHNTLQFSSWHISPATAPDYLKALADFKVQFIECYPSMVSLLAQVALEEPRFEIRPSCVVTMGETLMDWQRQAISAAFDCPVMDQYGCTEMAVMAYQCPEGGYHECCEMGIAEFLKPEGAPEGTPAEIVATGLLNFTQPLIRYRIGDTAIPDRGACPCGRGLPTVKGIVGRLDDILVTPSGRILARFGGMFKENRGVRECQIVQDALDHLLLRIVPTSEYSPAWAQAVIDSCRSRFGDEMRYDVELVDEIERTRGRKFRAVVSKIDVSQFDLFQAPAANDAGAAGSNSRPL